MANTIDKDLLTYILQLEENQQQELLTYVKKLLGKKSVDQEILKAKLTSRAKRSEEDIKNDRLYSRKEIEKRLGIS